MEDASRHLEQSLATPDSNNTHSGSIESIYDTKRWVDNLPQMSNTKLKHNTTAFREIGKSFSLGKHLAQQLLTHGWNLLICIPLAYFFKILDCRCSKGDFMFA